MRRDIYLCADDYAQNEGISDGIEALVQAKRINALSCMVTTPTWAMRASRLKKHVTSCYVGLHVNLTEGTPLTQAWHTHYGTTFKPLSWLMTMCFSNRLNRQILALELGRQLKTFIDQTGFFPDFIDGHQHVHQFPGIRDYLLSNYAGQIKIRNTSPRMPTHHFFDGFPKKQLIACLGGRKLDQMLIEKKATFNTSFSGVYHFKDATRYRQHFTQFLKNSVSHGLIMCHPGHDMHDHTDPLHFSRHHEFDYLMSDAYLDDMRAMNCVLIQKQRVSCNGINSKNNRETVEF